MNKVVQALLISPGGNALAQQTDDWDQVLVHLGNELIKNRPKTMDVAQNQEWVHPRGKGREGLEHLTWNKTISFLTAYINQLLAYKRRR